MAGESATELARRRREKAERLNRQAERYERGAAGEAATATALATLPGEYWRVFHDVRWPGRRVANIDHVVVGPSGVYVVDSKNWSGKVAVKDGVLRQNGYQRERYVNGAAEAALAIGQLVPGLDLRQVHPVICLTRDDAFHEVSRGVTICSSATLASLLGDRPPVMTPDGIHEIASSLEQGLSAATEPAAPVRPKERPAVRPLAAEQLATAPGASVAVATARRPGHRARRSGLSARVRLALLGSGAVAALLGLTGVALQQLGR